MRSTALQHRHMFPKHLASYSFVIYKAKLILDQHSYYENLNEYIARSL